MVTEENEISMKNLKKGHKMCTEQINEWNKTRKRLLNSGFDLSKCVLTREPDWR